MMVDGVPRIPNRLNVSAPTVSSLSATKRTKFFSRNGRYLALE